MPGSRGGGSFGGGGGHSFGGGSSIGGNGSKTNRYSKKPFVGAIHYYYFDRRGIRRTFYYQGVPVREKIGLTVVSLVLLILMTIFCLSFFLYFLVPHKLKASKCEFYPDYVYDASGLFSESDEEYLTVGLEKFYNETGVQPYVYVISYDDVPDAYKFLTPKVFEDYAYNLYVSTFNDEGHCLILCIINLEDDSGKWIEMTGYDAQDVFRDSDFKKFQIDLNAKLRVENCNRAVAIADAFTENIDTVMKLSKQETVVFWVFSLGLIFVIFGGIFMVIMAVKRMKEVNEYCTYREKNKGEQSEFIVGMDDDKNNTDLFD